LGHPKVEAAVAGRGYLPLFTVLFLAFCAFDVFEFIFLQSQWMQYQATSRG